MRTALELPLDASPARCVHACVCARAQAESDVNLSPWHPAETVKVPQMAESISEGTLKTWLKQPGDAVEADEEIATIETDKVRIAHFLRTPYAPRPSPKKSARL